MGLDGSPIMIIGIIVYYLQEVLVPFWQVTNEPLDVMMIVSENIVSRNLRTYTTSNNFLLR